MADKSAEIAKLEKLLDSGAKSVNVDGIQTTFASATQIRRRIRELQSETDGSKRRKPPVSTINIGAAF